MNLLKGNVLDYGCGKGADADILGIDKYDPYYYNELNECKYNTITCTYVLNVVSEEEELEIINKVESKLTKSGCAYFSVRRDGFQEGVNSRGTYQRISKPKLESVFLKKGAFEIYKLEKL